MIKNLKEIRIKKGLTQKDIAKMLNIDYTTYGRYENGLTEPNLETLIKISNILHTTLDTLLDVENSNNISKQQSELLYVFEQLPKLEQELVLDYAKKALKIVKQTKEEEIKNKIKK